MTPDFRINTKILKLVYNFKVLYVIICFGSLFQKDIKTLISRLMTHFDFILPNLTNSSKFTIFTLYFQIKFYVHIFNCI